MASTFTIPLTTLPVGTRTLGPATVADADTSVTFTIDRTVTGGLNSLTAASTLAAETDISLDGGVTWQELGAWTTIGGTILQKGVPCTVTGGTIKPLPAGTSRQARATVTVGGTSITVAGSLVTQ